MLGYLEKGTLTPMSPGRSTQIVSIIKWIRTRRLAIENSLSSHSGQFTRAGHIPGGGRPLLQEGGPISYEARPSPFFQSDREEERHNQYHSLAQFNVFGGPAKGLDCRAYGNAPSIFSLPPKVRSVSESSAP